MDHRTHERNALVKEARELVNSTAVLLRCHEGKYTVIPRVGAQVMVPMSTVEQILEKVAKL